MSTGVIPARDIELARAYPIRELWARLGLPALPEHGNIRSPFRPDRNPTCEVGGAKNIFFDFAAHETLDTIDLTRKVLDCSFPEAVAFILGRHPNVGGLIARASAHTASSRPMAARTLPAPTSPSPREKVCGWMPPGSPVALYYYCRPDGEPLYRKVRYKTETGKITPFQRYDPDRDAWVGGKGCMVGVERVLYRNEELPAFQKVFVVEGEKCADALWDLGILAVCNDSGAGHWRPEFSEKLRGKEVAILPDNDEPGRKHAAMVARALAGIARSVKKVELPGLGPKEDVYDWLMRQGEEL